MGYWGEGEILNTLSESSIFVPMGHKNVCINCRRVSNMGTDRNVIHESTCSECGEPMILMTHRFKPPKKSDDQKWLTVKFLLDNGFNYQHIPDLDENGKQKSNDAYIDYPENLRDAKEFIERYKRFKVN